MTSSARHFEQRPPDRASAVELAGARVVVTGAAGFIGSALTRALLETGCELRAFVRPTTIRTNLRNLPVETIEGDIRDPEALQKALAKARYVFHVAADYRLWARDPSQIFDSNVHGTRRVMTAALRAGVEKIVFTSSVATLEPRSDGQPVDETARAACSTAFNAYKKSKMIAERVVEEMIEEQDLPAVTVQPSTPIGPNDVRPTPTGRIVVDAACGRIPAFVKTGLNLVHVDDVANGHVLALKHGRIGERYILGGDDVLFQRMLADIAGLAERRPAAISLYREMLYPAAWIAEGIAYVTGKAPLLTVDSLRMARKLMFFSSSKAREEIFYTTRPYQDGLHDAVAWFRSNGYLQG